MLVPGSRGGGYVARGEHNLLPSRTRTSSRSNITKPSFISSFQYDLVHPSSHQPFSTMSLKSSAWFANRGAVPKTHPQPI